MRNSTHLLLRQVFWTTTVLVLALGGDTALPHFRLDPLESKGKERVQVLCWQQTIGTLITVAWKAHLGAHQT